MKKKKKTEAPLYPMVLETFRAPGAWGISQFRQDEPSCFNGIVNVRRYRITIEEISEDADAVVARIKKLWKESDNHHHSEPLRRAAAYYGIELERSDR